ncbi:hypothetical protein [Microbacterium elymi]|uniref:Uncharacterized protein n=1 Tax=Microbacterium elymi TaxID=2909587 RepID=A0ABY5NJZ1_9MICO|nr:hypothetical protein [Microbacterium elymi]UUT35454.1 hypothetical protein L2X98_18890 [Microbacterium elymi]
MQLFVGGGDASVDPNAVLTQLGRLVAAQTTQNAKCTAPDTVSG